MNNWTGLINKYRKYLPVSDKTPVITLNEGNTLLLESPRLAKALGQPDLKIFLKFEGQNPTGSFKDRGMTLAISKAVEEGAKAVICASTGNTSASAAAYASVAGIPCAVLIPEGKIARGKLAQAIFYGAVVIEIDGNFDEALELVRQVGADSPVTIVNSINPYRIKGQTTGAFEIVDQLGQAPDYQCMPVGNAGNITAYWEGYNTYLKVGKSNKLPKMCGFQAAGSAPIFYKKKIDKPETVATAIRIGNPASWAQADAAMQDSGGLCDIVTDEEILAAQKLIARTQGIFCEPASAASVAGLQKQINAGFFTHGAVITCILTGHGLKDPDIATRDFQPPIKLKPDKGQILKALGLS